MLNWLKNLFNKLKQPDPERELLEKICEQDLVWKTESCEGYESRKYVAFITDKKCKQHQIIVCTTIIGQVLIRIDNMWFSSDKNTGLQRQILKHASKYVDQKVSEREQKRKEDRKRKLKLINDNF